MNKDSMCRCGHSYDEHYNLPEEPEEECCLHLVSEKYANKEYCACMRFTVATDQDLLNATLRLHNAASIILEISSFSSRENGQACPHGNYPAYPTHAWWCDGCFRELGAALEEVTEVINRK